MAKSTKPARKTTKSTKSTRSGGYDPKKDLALAALGGMEHKPEGHRQTTTLDVEVVSYDGGELKVLFQKYMGDGMDPLPKCPRYSRIETRAIFGGLLRFFANERKLVNAHKKQEEAVGLGFTETEDAGLIKKASDVDAFFADDEVVELINQLNDKWEEASSDSEEDEDEEEEESEDEEDEDEEDEKPVKKAAKKPVKKSKADEDEEVEELDEDEEESEDEDEEESEDEDEEEEEESEDEEDEDEKPVKKAAKKPVKKSGGPGAKPKSKRLRRS
jgi:hypothetical protein